MNIRVHVAIESHFVGLRERVWVLGGSDLETLSVISSFLIANMSVTDDAHDVSRARVNVTYQVT